MLGLGVLLQLGEQVSKIEPAFRGRISLDRPPETLERLIVPPCLLQRCGKIGEYFHLRRPLLEQPFVFRNGAREIALPVFLQRRFISSPELVRSDV
jgi:hypothetical protein